MRTTRRGAAAHATRAVYTQSIAHSVTSNATECRAEDAGIAPEIVGGTPTELSKRRVVGAVEAVVDFVLMVRKLSSLRSRGERRPRQRYSQPVHVEPDLTEDILSRRLALCRRPCSHRFGTMPARP